jgi:hypothetical protein
MDNEFEGVRIDTNYTFYNHKNDNETAQALNEARGFALPDSTVNTGYTKDYSIAVGIGGAEGRGHATFYAGYRKADPILQSQYDHTACTLGIGTTAANGVGATNYSCGGSGTSAAGQFLVIDPRPPLEDEDGNPIPGGVETGGEIVSARTVNPDGTVRDFADADQYNFGPVNYFQRPDERYTAGAFANFKISEKADVYGELMFMDDRSVAQIAPSGAFLGAATFAVNCNNPLWSPEEFQEFCGQFGLTEDDFGSMLIGNATSKAAAARTTSATRHTAWWRACAARSTTS